MTREIYNTNPEEKKSTNFDQHDFPIDSDERHNAIPLDNGKFAMAWDIRCPKCRAGRKHFAKEYTEEELLSIKLRK